jgi:hypothetical protein
MEATMTLRRAVRGFIVLFVCAGGLLFLHPTPRLILLGRLRGEPCYRGRPVSYWNKVMKDYFEAVEAGEEAEYRPASLLDTLKGRLKIGTPVIQYGPLPKDRDDLQLIRLYAELVKDSDVGVRWYALRGLTGVGPNGKLAIPALLAVLNDDRHYREDRWSLGESAAVAIWLIDPELAEREGLWCPWRKVQPGR